jgi:hypothetical protein
MELWQGTKRPREPGEQRPKKHRERRHGNRAGEGDNTAKRPSAEKGLKNTQKGLKRVDFTFKMLVFSP